MRQEMWWPHKITRHEMSLKRTFTTKKQSTWLAQDLVPAEQVELTSDKRIIPDVCKLRFLEGLCQTFQVSFLCKLVLRWNLFPFRNAISHNGGDKKKIKHFFFRLVPKNECSLRVKSSQERSRARTTDQQFGFSKIPYICRDLSSRRRLPFST